MGEIILLDKTKADYLLSKGFKYTVRAIDKRQAYVFIQTPELVEELLSQFDNGSFFINKNVCF